MTYSFNNLSHADFEDLARDLLGQELGIRFEAFAAGPDGGMDGRHAAGENNIILQAKHLAGSAFSALKSSMAKSRPSIDALQPSRYLLVTSRALTPPNKATLAQVIGPTLQLQADIFGPGDLNGLLRKFPEIAKASIKLWLSGTAVLERIVHAAAEAFTAITREEIEAKVKVYAPNPSLKEARDKLEHGHVVIISGPPGVGKTTLAEMLSYAYIADGWDYIAIRSLDDGFAKLQDSRRQVFFFDDFLGSAALDTRALANKDSDLARFLKRVRGSANARFVLTTRAPIFEEARRVSEHLADKKLDLAKYVLDVGIYTRQIKARILYNHLAISGVSQEHVRALWTAQAIPKIVDHRNYNPRIIEAMTDGLQLRDILAEDYPSEFIGALNSPRRIWDVSFRKHIPEMCRHLLFALFFCSDHGVSIEELRVVSDGLHQFLSTKYSVPHGPKDFEESLRILEGGYVNISGDRVSFINPSLRDYLTDYVADVELVVDFALSAQRADWSERLWDHVRTTMLSSPVKQQRVARAFMGIAERFHNLPSLVQTADGKTWRFSDLSVSDRISLLISWSICGNEKKFADLALSLTRTNFALFNGWRDGRKLAVLLTELDEDGDYQSLHNLAALREAVEDALIGILERHIYPDDLENMFDTIESYEALINPRVIEAVDRALLDQFERIDALIEDIDSKSTLDDHISAVRRFAPRLGVAPELLARTVSKIEDKIAEVAASSEDASSPTFSAETPKNPDVFDDDALANLFAPLIHGMR